MKCPVAAPLVFQFKKRSARRGGAQETVRLIYNSVFRSLFKGVTNITQIMNVDLFIFYRPYVQGFGKYQLFNTLSPHPTHTHTHAY